MNLRVMPQAAMAPQTQDQRPGIALLHTIVDTLTQAGVDASTIDAARYVTARGFVAASYLDAARDLNNVELLDILEFNEVLAQKVARQDPLKPWLDAIDADKAQQAQIPPIAVFTVSCGDHRPGRLDSDEPLDMLPCDLDAHHDGDHTDRYGKTWARSEARK